MNTSTLQVGRYYAMALRTTNGVRLGVYLVGDILEPEPGQRVLVIFNANDEKASEEMWHSDDIVNAQQFAW